jgi:hypothetical protein
MTPVTRPCGECIEIADHPQFRMPLHLIHPIHRKPMTFDARGIAVCKRCGARWRMMRNNKVELLG